MSTNQIRNVVIVGGGTAGWLTAGVIAAEHMAHSEQGISVTLIESPDVKPVGVGEGTWPTMRGTLRKMGVTETDFIRCCDATFKQGAKFAKWVTGAKDDAYYHPLVLPQGYEQINLAPFWQQQAAHIPFADAVSFQGQICERDLAPKQNTTPEFAHVANYAYHLDAGKFAAFLQQHCTEKLGVKHILDTVIAINSHENGDIRSLSTKQHNDLNGDLFIDCSGFHALLIGKHYQIPFIHKKDILFNDAALAVHVPYPDEQSPIASHTISTGQSAGWIWDIGLPSRRGVGHVYSTAHISDEQAELELRQYIRESIGNKVDELDVRKIPIVPGHRETFWHKNCVAVGLSAGFLEPLEASALVLVELSAAMISEQLPANRNVMDIVAKRFNNKFRYRWDRIIDFLKLHYVLTKRTDSDYWIDNCRAETIPEGLTELMELWQHQSPWHSDFTQTDEVFPSASYQYVLYGMGFKTQQSKTIRRSDNQQIALENFRKNQQMTEKLLRGLPTNRELINKIHQYGLQRI
ncbi:MULTISPECIES: tryptophan halogenase family protein [Aliiglaciecola]|uniref:tryptophan halogenase family protein n=1 Tax=Aliiglaciecola TaxID=1406885 RepID=UPI001C09E0BA|nr:MULTISPECIES: tryptophan halogenase family protein [Aliiglaciecola]MBU2879342.1 tryptophan 7-halogenase [Aliiglaciecola lipolytica]MDO6709793.1 tryptophan 7-halogenase [Aliiglaciecola sp. 2_MG-2023]MDO6750665.1 tryptophan 7-halogenase [Aliiglaciecola sp. 1_MG-2023]